MSGPTQGPTHSPRDSVASYLVAPAALPRANRQPWLSAVRILTAASAAVGLLVARAEAQVNSLVGPMPHGWYAVGIQSGDYEVGTDVSRRNGGQAQHGATVHSLRPAPGSFATLQQSIQADRYHGQRVRLSGFVKTNTLLERTEILGATAALWMRVDGPSGAESADYMRGRPITQGTDWTLYEVVLDVPWGAVGLSFGILMNGRGQVWLDDVSLESVGLEVPLTGGAKRVTIQDARRRRRQLEAYDSAPLGPVNLDFNEGTRIP